MTNPHLALVPQLTVHDILSRRLKEERAKKGWSQMKLAEVAHLGLPTVSALECSNSNTRLSTLITVSRALDCPLHSLLNPADFNPAILNP